VAERKTYREKLLDPRWQRRRLEILSAADFTCRDCGDKTKTLHVHHAYYLPEREPWEYPDDLLRCVCDDCHREHAEADDQLRADLQDLEMMLQQCSLRSKYAAANGVHTLAGLILSFRDLGAIALSQAAVEFEAFAFPCAVGEEMPGLKVLRSLKARSDGLYAAEGGRFISTSELE